MRTLAVVAFLMSIQPAQAQEKLAPPPAPREIRLSLKEGVYLALNHNLDIEISRYQPWIDDQSLLSTFGAFDHVLYMNGTEGRTRQASSTIFTGASTLDTESTLFTTGVRRTLPFGGRYDLNFSTNRTENNSVFSTVNPLWFDALGVNFTMPLARGFGESATTTPVILARNTRQISVHQFERSLTDTVLSVHQAYWRLVAAIETKHFREQALEVANRLLDDNQKRFDRGNLAKVDVTQAESGVASQVEGILTAEKDVQDAMDRLKRLVDPALLREEVEVLPLEAPRSPEKPLDERVAIETGLRDAFEKRPEYRQIRVQIESQERTLARAANERLPKVDATASGSFNGIDDTFGAGVTEMGKLDTYGWTVGVVVEIPLENRSANGAAQRAELERRRLVLQNRNLEDQVLVEIREAVREIKTVEKRIEATRKARALAQEQFEGEMNRLDQGMRTTFHVLDAQSKLSEARTNEIRALVDYRLALAGFERVTGTLLQRNDILVDQNLAPRQ